MKKICLIVCVMILAPALAFADDEAAPAEMVFSGEVKTGLLWDQIYEPNPGAQDTVSRARLGNNDDAGEPGRIRLNGELTKGNIGFRMRWELFDYKAAIAPLWAYVYAYGDFIDGQLRLSGGRLGQSPWSTGGYELWKELDNVGGLRVEGKPHVVEGLNVGFVLNGFNAPAVAIAEDQKLEKILAETIIGASYTHEYFHVRAAWRFDSTGEGGDGNYNGGALDTGEGQEFVYRVEERVLSNYVDGLSIFANGYFKGIMARNPDDNNYVNWVYIQYKPEAFPLDAQLRTGLDAGYKKYIFKLKPVVTYSVTDFFRPGIILYYDKDFGEAAPSKDKPYKTVAVEPFLRFTLMNDMYADIAYRYQQEYTAVDRQRTTNWVNIRFVYFF